MYLSRPPIKSKTGEKNQSVKEHLIETEKIATKWHSWAAIAGRWHDLGKLKPEWQQYIREAMTGKPLKSPGHSKEGAVLAWSKKIYPVAIAILGHHSGLSDFFGQNGVRQKLNDITPWENIKDIAIQELGKDFFIVPFFIPNKTPIEDELLTRIIFSCLIDADRESAARFMGTFKKNPPPKSMKELLACLTKEYVELNNQPHKNNAEITNIRKELKDNCEQASKFSPGFFRLSAPTGSGKTLSVMSFAFNHAINYQMDRIIYCPPFTSIIDQVAHIFKTIFGNDAVLEHHSGCEISEDQSREYFALTERWDFPIIVTTQVELFESLFSNNPSKCRKNHRIINSIIILDEVQAIPLHYLKPIMDILQELVLRWNCTVVLSSATHPYYGVLDLPCIKNISVSNEKTNSFLTKKTYKYIQTPLTWENIADQIIEQNSPNTLIVVNTRKDAQDGYKKLSFLGDIYHLSANMYPAHRKKVLAEIKTKLENVFAKKPVIVISTQLIEAGVDFSFNLGYRALTGLDSLIQTGGRINRNGTLKNAIINFFELKDGNILQSEKQKIKITQELINAYGIESIAKPSIIEIYYKKLLNNPDIDLDVHQITSHRERMAFRTVNDKFKLIIDWRNSVLICEEAKIKRLVQDIKNGIPLTNKIRQLIQQYSVSINNNLFNLYADKIHPNIYVWKGEYNWKTGIETTENHENE